MDKVVRSAEEAVADTGDGASLAVGGGLGLLLAADRIARVTGSYVGKNKEFARRYLTGELDLELIPQGMPAERLRAGGCGIPAFFTPAGGVAVAAQPKEVREFGGREYVLEHGTTTDFALVHAARGDRHRNLVFAKAARNFNPWPRWPAGSPLRRSRSWWSRARSIRMRCICPGCLCSAWWC